MQVPEQAILPHPQERPEPHRRRHASFVSLLILVLPLSACVVYDRNDHRHRPDYRYERYHDRDRDNRGRDWNRSWQERRDDARWR